MLFCWNKPKWTVNQSFSRDCVFKVNFSMILMSCVIGYFIQGNLNCISNLRIFFILIFYFSCNLLSKIDWISKGNRSKMNNNKEINIWEIHERNSCMLKTEKREERNQFSFSIDVTFNFLDDLWCKIEMNCFPSITHNLSNTMIKQYNWRSLMNIYIDMVLIMSFVEWYMRKCDCRVIWNNSG